MNKHPSIKNSFRRIVQAGLALLLAAVLWLLLVHWLFVGPDKSFNPREAGIAPKAQALAARHLQLWQYEDGLIHGLQRVLIATQCTIAIDQLVQEPAASCRRLDLSYELIHEGDTLSVLTSKPQRRCGIQLKKLMLIH